MCFTFLSARICSKNRRERGGEILRHHTAAAATAFLWEADEQAAVGVEQDEDVASRRIALLGVRLRFDPLQ